MKHSAGNKKELVRDSYKFLKLKLKLWKVVIPWQGFFFIEMFREL